MKNLFILLSLIFSMNAVQAKVAYNLSCKGINGGLDKKILVQYEDVFYPNGDREVGVFSADMKRPMSAVISYKGNRAMTVLSDDQFSVELTGPTSVIFTETLKDISYPCKIETPIKEVIRKGRLLKAVDAKGNTIKYILETKRRFLVVKTDDFLVNTQLEDLVGIDVVVSGTIKKGRTMKKTINATSVSEDPEKNTPIIIAF